MADRLRKDKFEWGDDDVVISSPQDVWNVTYRVPLPGGGTREEIVDDFNGLQQHLMQKNPDGDLDADFRAFMKSPIAKFMPKNIMGEIVELDLL